ncbi:HalOD1 output domain-containing protein [Natrinema sp. 1APR25-10V2]|uniref:HalOD1 output domain-containing protein n=1 Tax=Natrinema sp. 1APR25-10V2 TaxID=2951081 RepID=UPI0028765177|nr:HalOD1 output domain-containing protein [Natrinema sp. 1APR25-10V2]MDS0477867.1 hypothetical protein [Natrinema sp. 1APR25-10V2]
MDIGSDELSIETPASPSSTVVMGVAERERTSPLEIEPLYETIDPDALDRLFPNDGSVRITFEYSGYLVTVHGNGHIEIRDVGIDIGE